MITTTMTTWGSRDTPAHLEALAQHLADHHHPDHHQPDQPDQPPKTVFVSTWPLPPTFEHDNRTRRTTKANPKRNQLEESAKDLLAWLQAQEHEGEQG